MTDYLILTCWNQKQRYTEIKEYYNIIKEVCSLHNSVKIMGLYKPLHEGWHWAFLYHVDSLATWEKVEEEIERKYIDKLDNISQKTSRIYVERFLNPLPADLESVKYLEIELYRWEGIDIGLKRYYDTVAYLANQVTDVWFMGIYSPANEDYNWVNFFQYESIKNIDELDEQIYGSIGRPEQMFIGTERLYKRYEP